MKIILQKDMDELGFEGDIIDVARGYARNYLIPKGFAVEATLQNMKAFELKRKKIEARKLREKEDALKLKEKVESLEISLTKKAGEEGKLYGSVTNIDIASELEKEGIVVDRKKILLDKPIKNVGDFEVPVKLYPEVIANLRVKVLPEKEEKEKQE
ncbi:MAG: 50S ribosomal protein L9 [Deltaproteobacteria bacterium]|nr:MAG: 50S ribosomal protein L9 [Deltaproteobacteria bacterium]